MHLVVADRCCLTQAIVDWPGLEIAATDTHSFTPNLDGEPIDVFDPEAAQKICGDLVDIIRMRWVPPLCHIALEAGVYPAEGGWMVVWDSRGTNVALTSSMGVYGIELFRSYLRILVAVSMDLSAFQQLTCALTIENRCFSAGYLRIFGPLARGDTQAWAVVDMTSLPPPFKVRCRKVRPGGEPPEPLPSISRLRELLAREPMLNVEYSLGGTL